MASFARMGEEVSVAPAPIPQREQDWAARLEETIVRGGNHLLAIQAEEGYWQGELEADTTLESDYIYYLHVLGKADPERIAKLANYVRRRQLPDGGWPIYPHGPSELNATCKAYFALKLAGDSPDARHMVEARGGAFAGRTGTLQFLRAVLSGAGRRGGLGTGARDSAGADAAAELVLSEHLRDVVVDARDCDPDVDPFGAAAGLPLAGACAR